MATLSSLQRYWNITNVGGTNGSIVGDPHTAWGDNDTTTGAQWPVTFDDNGSGSRPAAWAGYIGPPSKTGVPAQGYYGKPSVNVYAAISARGLRDGKTGGVSLRFGLASSVSGGDIAQPVFINVQPGTLPSDGSTSYFLTVIQATADQLVDESLLVYVRADPIYTSVTGPPNTTFHFAGVLVSEVVSYWNYTTAARERHIQRGDGRHIQKAGLTSSRRGPGVLR